MSTDLEKKIVDDFWLTIVPHTFHVGKEEGQKFVQDWLLSTLKEYKAEILKERHNTRDGYCCACDYDIAGFENKLKEQKIEIGRHVMAAVPEANTLKSGEGEKKSLYNLGFNFCRSATLSALEKIFSENEV